MLATFLGIYLILGLPVALLVWMILKASKRRGDEQGEVQEQKYDRSNYNRFHERKTEPDSVRS